MKIGKRQGFSLIEIGIVMVVIGLIIAAVMKGKDVIKGAEVKETSQNFMAKWQGVADTYYDKLGYNLYGSSYNRMILGAVAANDTTPHQAEITSLLCDDTNGLAVIGRNLESGTAPGTTRITDEVEFAGINLRKVIRTNTNNVCRQNVSGEYTEDAMVELEFGYVAVNAPANATATGNSGNGGALRNVLIFKNVPVDVAKAFDKLIDTTVDGTSGKVLSPDATGYTTAITVATAQAYSTLTPNAWPDVVTATNVGNLQTVYLVLDH